MKRVLCGLALLCVAGATLAADAFPTRPIRLVVTAAPSTPVDILSRVVAERLGAELGQPIVVDLRPGATGTVGAREALHAPADGYTLVTFHMPMSVAQTLYANVPFDLQRDFAPVGQAAWSYNVLVVHPSVAARTPGELAAVLAAQPGKLNFASGGPGTPAHIAGELFKMQTQAQAVHVPYNQFPQAIADLLGGQNQFMFAAVPPMLPHIQAGKLRALAVTGPQRLTALKEVPTMVESGYPDFVVRDWLGFAAKAGCPPEIIATLNAALQRALASDAVRSGLAKLGADPAPGEPQAFGRLVAAEVARWGRVARQASLRVD